MKIISANVGNSVTVEWQGKQIQTGIYKTGIDAPVYLGKEDVLNDHVINRQYHGGVDKACYLYSADHYPYWKDKYTHLEWQWGMFGENLTVEGLDESEIHIGDYFRIGQVIVQVSQPRQPCFKLGIRFRNQQIVEDFWNSKFPGIYVRVLNSGHVENGDEMLLIERNEKSLSVSQIFSIFRLNMNNTELIHKALEEPHLAESCRMDIQKILENKRLDD